MFIWDWFSGVLGYLGKWFFLFLLFLFPSYQRAFVPAYVAADQLRLVIIHVNWQSSFDFKPCKPDNSYFLLFSARVMMTTTTIFFTGKKCFISDCQVFFVHECERKKFCSFFTKLVISLIYV